MRLNSLSESHSSPSAPKPRGRDAYAVIFASGPEDGGKRATLALAAACTAQAMDMDTIVFLLGDGVRWAYEGHVDHVQAPGFPALADLIDSFVEAGGKLLMCSACDGRATQCAASRRARQWARLASVSQRRRRYGYVLSVECGKTTAFRTLSERGLLAEPDDSSAASSDVLHSSF